MEETQRLLCVCVQLGPTLCNPMDCSLPAPLSMELSRQEYWNRLPKHKAIQEMPTNHKELLQDDKNGNLTNISNIYYCVGRAI